jgi:ribose transport system substrate-binding protein
MTTGGARVKKLWILTVLGIAAAGCNPPATGGTEGGGGTGGTPVAATGKKLKIGVSIPAADHGWTAGVGYWAKEVQAKQTDIEWIIEDAKSADEQIKDLENLQTQGVDGMVILAVDSAPLTPTAKKLKDAGMFIVNVDRGFTEPVADVFIEGDNAAFGRKSAEFMVGKLGGKGNIVILEGIAGTTVSQARVKAFKEVIATEPGIKIVAQQAADWNREKAEKVMQNILVSTPQIDAVWASDDDMALGVENALKSAGRDKNIWILGGAGMKDIVKRVMDRDPLYPANITYPPSMIAVGMQTASAMLKAGLENTKKYMPRHLVLDVELITPENAQDFYFPDSIY